MKRYRDCAEAIEALARGLDDATCHDFQTVREVVMCRAWQDFRDRQAGSLHDAIQAGWSAVRSACAAHGGTRPEFGFLEAVQAHAGEGPSPSVVNAYEVRDRTGQAVGVVVEMSDGTADTCAGNACRQFASLAEALASLGSEATRR